jgi:hypothetical protein|eukprot:COSAG02_NODE_5310_length_4449_cov_5.367586_2_plen_315_part_00
MVLTTAVAMPQVKGLKVANSKTPVPKELQEMCDSYEAKRKAGTAGMKSSGFGGRGFAFDEKEAVAAAEGKAKEKEGWGVQVHEEKEEYDECAVPSCMPVHHLRPSRRCSDVSERVSCIYVLHAHVYMINARAFREGNLIVKGLDKMEAMFESSTSDAKGNNAAAQGASPTAAAQAAANAAISGSVSSSTAPGTAPISTGNSVLDKAMAAIRQAGMGGAAPSTAAADGTAAAPAAAGPSPVAAAETRLQELMKKQATMNSVTEHLQAGDETAALGCLIKITGVPQPLGPGKIASQEIARCVDLPCHIGSEGLIFV